MSNSSLSVVVDSYGLSDVGLVRTNNEDSFLIASPTNDFVNRNPAELNGIIPQNGTMFLVADGMGGAQAGEVASRMAVETVGRNFIDALGKQVVVDQQSLITALTETIREANELIFQQGQKRTELNGMGTTLTAAIVLGGTILFAQLGDSRAYLARKGVISQMTKDQSLVAQMVASGSLTPEEAKTHPKRNVILQALGIQSQVDVAITLAELRRGDQIVLCSDGLSGKVDAEEIKEFLEKFEPKAACQGLVRMARERGGEDNITVIVARFNGDGLSEPSPEDVTESPNTKMEAARRRSFWPWRR
ncbi:MAG TPA: Stp1/IreP family PP2C-type Ser/Thr phosphatase [Candidatus Binatia bacterium]|nr:Stp1/IreP family PP2C-type Ser/Thr phosphatase [Candidatus Binatia bacterium]